MTTKEIKFFLKETPGEKQTFGWKITSDKVNPDHDKTYKLTILGTGPSTTTITGALSESELAKRISKSLQ